MTIGKPRPGGAFPPSETGESAEAWRARGAELEAVIDGTPFMLARLGRDMRYRFISSAYARMIARRSEDVIGKHVADVLGQEGFAAVRPYIEKVLRGEPTEYELEKHRRFLRRRDLQRRPRRPDCQLEPRRRAALRLRGRGSDRQVDHPADAGRSP